ncbi:MAG: hypothetical protein JO228_09885 [Xanthobacteraceae bacterium]|nr:hypothetical protein [Xanthobacteraceae bacterium]
MISNAFRWLTLLAALPAALAVAHAAEAQFPTGSLIGFVPPPGFIVSKHFPGYEDSDGGSMVLLALPPQAYTDIEKSMTPEAFKAQGITEEKRENLALPDGKGVLVTGSEQENGQKFRKWMFLGAVPTAIGIAAVRIPDGAVKSDSDALIKTSLLTMTARPSVPIEEQLSLVPFKLGEMSGMRPVRILGGTGVFLTDGPKDAPAVAEQPVFIASIGQGGPEQAAERVNFARNLFTGLADFKDIRIVSGDMLRLGGGTLPTHELQAEAKDAKTDTPMKIVQWVRFGPGAFVRMVGVARADVWSKEFPRFRAVRDGIGPRVEE